LITLTPSDTDHEIGNHVEGSLRPASASFRQVLFTEYPLPPIVVTGPVVCLRRSERSVHHGDGLCHDKGLFHHDQKVTIHSKSQILALCRIAVCVMQRLHANHTDNPRYSCGCLFLAVSRQWTLPLSGHLSNVFQLQMPQAVTSISWSRIL
jgi:hypothetical protein